MNNPKLFTVHIQHESIHIVQAYSGPEAIEKFITNLKKTDLYDQLSDRASHDYGRNQAEDLISATELLFVDGIADIL